MHYKTNRSLPGKLLQNIKDPWLSLWRILFAVVAVADLTTCWPVLQGLAEGEHDSYNETRCKAAPRPSWRDDHKTVAGSCSTPSPAGWIAPLFCFFCVVEAIIHAKGARAMAMENHALDNFEKTLSRAYSTTRMSFGVFGVSPDANVDEILARSTLRIWIPVGVTITFWLSLMPTSYDFQCGNDTALATMWISSAFAHYTIFSEEVKEQVSSALWRWALPYKVSQPRRLYKRIRQLLRCIRFVRFAAPLARMNLKLGDQFWALSKTWRQSLVAQTEKAKRLAQRSMLFEDIKRVESLAKIQTALAALPSQLFSMAQDELTPISRGLQQQQEQGREIKRQLQQLRNDISRNISTSDLYDRVIRLTQELKVTLNNTFLSSHHLISPHSRFSVVWRMTVTNCLMLEIFRLSVSWHLSGTFKISLPQIISRLLIDCEDPEMTKHFAFITDRVDDVRKHLSNIFPLLPPPENLTICVPLSPSSKLFLRIGGMLESFIDVVSFFDIFIWFFTGDLDVTGVIIPKPFFSRCILPGTLVQVLDHPTLPETLPALIRNAMDAAGAAGWGRALRWGLAVIPAFVMFVFNPLKSYFFRHMDTTEGLMRYAESCGMLAPARFSTKNLRGHDTHGNLLAVTSYQSQVGMSFDSPNPGRRVVSVSTDDNLSQLPPPPVSPPSVPRNKSIQFSTSVTDLGADDDSYRLSYSSRNLLQHCLHED